MDKRSWPLPKAIHSVSMQQGWASGGVWLWALHLIPVQYASCIPRLPPNASAVLAPSSPRLSLTAPDGGLGRVTLFGNLNPKFSLHRSSTRAEAFRFSSPRSASGEQQQKDQLVAGLLLPLEKAPQGLMQKEVPLWMRHRFNLYLI